MKVFGRHNWKFLIPFYYGGTISLDITDGEPESDDEPEMPATLSDTLNLIKNYFPDVYEGDPKGLQTFVDSLDQAETLKDAFEPQIVGFIKTRLRGAARTYINNAATINAIKNALTGSIKLPSSAELNAKLSAVDPRGRQHTEYAKEIEDISQMLKLSYIGESVPPTVAESYATEAAIKAITAKSTDNKLNTVLEAAPLSSVTAVTAKFLKIKSEQQQQHIMKFGGQNRQNFNRRRNHNNQYRGKNNRGRGNYYQNDRGGNRNNNRGGNRGRGNYAQRSNYGNYGNNNRSNNNNSYVRTIHDTQGHSADQGNDLPPQTNGGFF